MEEGGRDTDRLKTDENYDDRAGAGPITNPFDPLPGGDDDRNC